MDTVNRFGEDALVRNQDHDAGHEEQAGQKHHEHPPDRGDLGDGADPATGEEGDHEDPENSEDPNRLRRRQAEEGPGLGLIAPGDQRGQWDPDLAGRGKHPDDPGR